MTELKRDLGDWAAAAILVGTVIGSGIFLVPHDMIARVGTPGMVLVVWVFGGLLTLAGSLSYAELAAAIPEAGAEYGYLREAYGPIWGFAMQRCLPHKLPRFACDATSYTAGVHPDGICRCRDLQLN